MEQEFGKTNDNLSTAALSEIAAIKPDTQKADIMVSQFDPENLFHIQRFGVNAQKEISQFSTVLLDAMQENQIDSITSSIKETAGKIEAVYPKETAGFFKRLFARKNYNKQIQEQFTSLEYEIDQIGRLMNQYKVLLLKDIALLEELYKKNAYCLEEIITCIDAGEKILLLLRSSAAKGNELVRENTADHFLQTQKNDKAELFAKRLNDLKTTKLLSMQMAPQIRMIQKNDQILLQRIQETLSTTLPLWKNQISLSLGLANTQEAMEAQKDLSGKAKTAIAQGSKTIQKQQRALSKTARKDKSNLNEIESGKQKLLDAFDQIFEEQKNYAKNRNDVKHAILSMEEELKV